MAVWKLVATGFVVAIGTLNAAQAKPHETIPRVDRDQLRCLALNIYHEARGEPDAGKIAVAHVVMNRVKSRRFPNSICKVVMQGGEKRRFRCQFSWRCDGQPDAPKDRRAWRKSKRVAQKVFTGHIEDRTSGALWYHAESVRPYWRLAFNQGPKIGQHIFYNDKRTIQQVASSRQSSGMKQIAPAKFQILTDTKREEARQQDKRVNVTILYVEAIHDWSSSETFIAEYRAPLSGPRDTPTVKVAAPDSLRWPVERDNASGQHHMRDESVRKVRHRNFDSLDEKYAHKLMIMIDTWHVSALRDEMMTIGSMNTVNKSINMLNILSFWAENPEQNLAQFNPERDVKPISTSSINHHTAEVEEVRRYEERNPVGSEVRLALTLMHYVGTRASDAISLGLAWTWTPIPIGRSLSPITCARSRKTSPPFASRKTWTMAAMDSDAVERRVG